MKQLLNSKENILLLEDLVRTMSKGYYSDFNEAYEIYKPESETGRGKRKVVSNQLSKSDQKKES